MLWRIAWFELRFWLRSAMLAGFFSTIALLIFGAFSSPEVMAEFGLGNTYRNAPFAVAYAYAAMGLFTLLMTAVFVNFAALRDVSYNTQALILATPVRRRDLLLGRFLGASAVSLIPLLGVSCGILAARFMPWADAASWGPIGAGGWRAHAAAFALFAVPDTLFSAAVLFAVAIVWRRELACFAAAIAIFAGRSLAGGLLQDLRWESLRALLDPFGVRAFLLATKYWTAADKNARPVGVDFGGPLLLNRGLWVAVGGAALALAYWRFGVSQRLSPGAVVDRRRAGDRVARGDRGVSSDCVARGDRVTAGHRLTLAPPATPLSWPRPRLTAAFWPRFRGVCALHFRAMAKHPAFAVIVTIAAILCGLALAEPATQFQANEAYAVRPVTYQVIELIRQVLDLFLVVLITYFSGALVWKDREDRMDAILDATPAPAAVSYAGRLAALVGLLLSIQALALAGGIASQALHGYHRFQLGLYADELLVRDASGLLCLAVLALFVQALAPNKYVGYFTFLALYTINTYVWPALDVSTHLVQFAGRPRIVYSDFFGDAPYRQAWNWFTAYWLFGAALLGIATVMLWPRGHEGGALPSRQRFSGALSSRQRFGGALSSRQRFGGARRRVAGASMGWKVAGAVCALGLAVSGGIIWYNTAVLNPLLGPREAERLQADYEKVYKPLAGLPQPRVRSVRYAIDLFPQRRRVEIHGEEVIANATARPLAEVHFSLDRHYETEIALPGAVLAADDRRLSYRRYRFAVPLAPGETRTLRFIVRSTNRGFENELGNPQVVGNGTFLSNLGSLVGGANYLAPIIGYDSWRELNDAAARQRYGLPAGHAMPALERGCTAHCGDTYFPGHADWVDASAVISTPPDQIAVAPGSLVKQWQQGGRRYFAYRLDHPSMNLYFFAAARYQVAREDWQGVKLEVYHLAEHPWNVGRMLDGMRQALDYCSRNFGPYRHRQARIVEFPRVASFAAAFAGSMPFSEEFGFLAEPPRRDGIDTVLFVVAHEVAHQWWDEQVIGADMEGATLLSETLAQYSALMVMQHAIGRERMATLLRYEHDLYLRARGQARQLEPPLLRVGLRDFPVFYQKGGTALYALQEMIGEEAVNRALRRLVERYAYAPPPYPTSLALLDALREETPPDRRYLLRDLFADITLFDNRTLAATASRRRDGGYDVAVDVEVRKFKADGAGREIEVPVDDWIDVGAFGKPAAAGGGAIGGGGGGGGVGGAGGAVAAALGGDMLYRQRAHVTQRRTTFRFTTAALPDRAGIDPYSLLMNRSPDGALRTVTLIGTGR